MQSLEPIISRLRSPIAVVAHDAGAANLIIGWLSDCDDLEIKISLGGPAERLWKATFGNAENLSIQDALAGASILISGTSYISLIEHAAREAAKERHVYSVAVIDHWVNYRERFLRNSIQILPDEVWVADQFAFKLAKNCFSELPVQQLPNRYMENQVSEISELRTKARPNLLPKYVLYVLEPIRSSWVSTGPAGEFQALEYFLSNLRCLQIDLRTEIRLRPHPSEPKDKYQTWVKARNLNNIVIDSTTPLPVLIAWADIVVGCETVAMVVAHHSGARVVSTLPPQAPRARLPIEALVHLRDIVSE